MQNVVIVGAGPTGLVAGALLARQGHRVTVLDRDASEPAEKPEENWANWQRPGVSQFRQPHLVQPIWREIMDREFPGLVASLRANGGRDFNMLYGTSASWVHAADDHRYDTIAVRRPVLEAVLARFFAEQPGLTIRRGIRATGLIMDRVVQGVPHVAGVRTSGGLLPADLVVDASGRRTVLPEWATAMGFRPPAEYREHSGFIYYSRYYKSDTYQSSGLVDLVTNQESMSMLALPGDNQAMGVSLVISARDRQLRLLRHPHVWQAVVRRSSAMRGWADAEPVSDVRPLAGIDHVHRTYVVDGQPVIAGVVAIGDALAATNPTLGLGISLGAMQACALRDVLIGGTTSPIEVALRFQAFCDSSVRAAINMALSYDGHRSKEIDSEIAGKRYETNDASWLTTVALMSGARYDSVVRRAHVGISALLKDSTQVLTGAEIQQRLTPLMQGPRYAEGSLSRKELLSVVTEAASSAEASR